MKLRAPIIALWLAGLVLMCQAQDKAVEKADPHAFSIRVYRLPLAELTDNPGPGDSGVPEFPAVPGDQASAPEIQAFLKHNHQAVKHWLTVVAGIELPKGSLACYDPKSGTLALRAMACVQEPVKFLSESAQKRLPGHINWLLEIVEAPAEAVRSAIKEAHGKASNKAALDHLLPHGKLMVRMHGEASPGELTSAEQGNRMTVPFAYEMTGDHLAPTEKFELSLGTHVEIRSGLRLEGDLIEIQLSLTHRYSPPIPHWEPQFKQAGVTTQAQWFDYPEATVEASTFMPDRTTRLMGVWTLEGVAEPRRLGAMQAAFLSVELVRLQPPEDRRVEQLVKDHGETEEPAVWAECPVLPSPKPGELITRVYQVPPDFGSGPEPENFPPRNNFTVKNLLESIGAKFPEGATAFPAGVTSGIIVRNTADNLDIIEAYVDSVVRESCKTTVLTLHVVQADGALIRKLASQTRSLSDHTAAWREIEQAIALGKARIVRSLLTHSTSRCPASASNVIQYSHGSEVSFSRADAAKTDHAPELSILSGPDPVGLSFYSITSIAAGASAIKQDFSMHYDFAPPLAPLTKEVDSKDNQWLFHPVTNFRLTKINTSITTPPGFTRMLSVWKPSGTPELDGDVLQAAFLHAEVIRVEPAK